MDESRAQKKERHEMEALRRASLVDEEARRTGMKSQLLGYLAPEMWRQREALLIVLLFMRTLLRVSILHR